jgi:site-specific DNA-adenine methylase
MFSYYGSKSKIVGKYPQPVYDKIIEPFAGSARYALKYHDREVVLYETYHKVYEVWKYLIKASMRDILALPDLEIGDDIREHKYLSDAERWLIGYQLQRGNARPGCIVNARCNWNRDKIRIANTVDRVKHWEIRNESGVDADWGVATVFCDPPYMVQKHGYTDGAVDYVGLSNKILASDSHVIVCGNSDDSWMDFEPLCEMQGINKKHTECVYVHNGLASSQGQLF